MADVLVTGAFGFFGNHVMRRLVREGVRPVGVSRNPDLSVVQDIAEDIDVARGDITNLLDLLHIIKKYKVRRIIHTARESETNPYLGFQVGAVGMVNVLEAARLMDIERVVYTSSPGVYGPITDSVHAYPQYAPLPETHIRNPEYDNISAACKVLGENMGWAYHRRYGLEFAALRFGRPWGPGKPAHHGRLSIFSRMVQNAMLGRPTRIPKGGDTPDDMVYLKDVAQGIVRACYAPSVPSMFYNIACGRLVTLHDFAGAVNKVLPGAQIEIGPGLDYKDSGQPNYALRDIGRARQELGYEPEYADLEASVRDYVQTMKVLGLEPQPS